MTHCLRSPALFLPFWFSSHRLSLLHTRCSELDPTGVTPSPCLSCPRVSVPHLLSLSVPAPSLPQFSDQVSHALEFHWQRGAQSYQDESCPDSVVQSLSCSTRYSRGSGLTLSYMRAPGSWTLGVWHRAWELALPGLSRMESESPSGCRLSSVCPKMGLLYFRGIILKSPSAYNKNCN